MNTSQLETAADRFLSLCLQQALDDGWLTPNSFIEEFPPLALMTGLEPASALRSKLLVEAAGVHEKIAPKKSTTAAAEDLQIAMEEGICDAPGILDLVPLDEFVRYLDTQQLWDLLVRDEFWKSNGEKEQVRLLHMLETALDQELIDWPRLLSAVSPERLAADLPRELLELAFVQALNLGLDKAPMDPAQLLVEVPLSTWLVHTPLVHIWEAAVAGEIAPSAGFGSLSTPRAPSEASLSPASKDTTEAKAEPVHKKQKKEKNKKKGGAPNNSPASPTPPSAEAASAKDKEEAQARGAAIAMLKKLERLPARADTMRTPVLLAIEAMYAEMQPMTSDEDRQECIEDAFPNEGMLQEALYPLAEALDPRLTEADLKKRGVDKNGLVQLILFEERRRTNRAQGISPSAPPPPVSPGSGSPPPPLSPAVSSPPPLPAQARKASTPPPPLPSQATRRAR